MTRIKLKAFVLACAFAALIYGAVIYAQSSQPGNVSKPSRTVAEGPVVDYAGPDSPDSSNDLNLTGTERDRRHAKSASYDRPNSLPIKEEPGTWPVNLSSHWWLHLPALPVTQSDAIALGTITGSRAFLSKDKHAVYSEFSLQIEQILKDKTQNINPGAVVTTTRYGGIVRFPSGTRYVYRLSRQAWPSIGSRYVLFLRKNRSGDFDIVTGYELRDGVTEPLDGTDLPSALPFKKYAGTPEPMLLDAIKSALANSAAGEHNL
jgi:hypothetical protein